MVDEGRVARLLRSVDDAIVIAALERLDEFDAFVSSVSDWLAEQRR